MGIPGDTFTALSRLSNRRKVRSVGNEEEPYVPDLAGIDSGVDQLPMTSELPGEDSPQSYDARANKLIDTQPQPEQQQPDFYELGQNLANFVAKNEGGQEVPQSMEAPPSMPPQQPIPSEPMQQPAPMTQAPPPAQEERGMMGTAYDYTLGPVFQALSDYVNPQKRKEVSEGNAKLFEDNKLREEAQQQNMSLEEYKKKQADEYGQDQETWQNQISEAAEQPYTKTVYGATDAVLNHPPLREEVESIVGPIDEQTAEMTRIMETALSDKNDEELKAQGTWNKQVEEVRERLDNNKATDNDKYLIGLALIMPLIVAGIFGKEAALGALGGGAEGMMKVYQNREKRIREDEDKITDLTKLIRDSELKQQDLEIEKAKIPSAVKKAVGESPKAHLEGRQMIRYTDPEGNVVEGVRLKPGIVAKEEFLADKEDLKEMRKEAQEVNVNRENVKKLGNNARRVVDIAMQIGDEGTFQKIFQSWAKGKKPSVVAKFGKEIELDGRKVNSAVALTQTLEDMLEARRNIQKIKNFGPQLFEHFERILTNPYGEFTTPQDLIDQTLRIYTDSRDQFLDSADMRGFLREPLLDDFYQDDVKMFDRLNRKEDRGEAQGLKKQLMAEEANAQ